MRVSSILILFVSFSWMGYAVLARAQSALDQNPGQQDFNGYSLSPGAASSKGATDEYGADSISEAHNALYAEAGATSIILSANYERKFMSHLLLRFGVGYYQIRGPFLHFAYGVNNATIANYTCIPFSLSYLCFGTAGHMPTNNLEVGIAATPFFYSTSQNPDGEAKSTTFLIPSILAGYRYQDNSGGLVFRADIAPYWIRNTLVFWAGGSAGVCF